MMSLCEVRIRHFYYKEIDKTQIYIKKAQNIVNNKIIEITLTTCYYH